MSRNHFRIQTKRCQVAQLALTQVLDALLTGHRLRGPFRVRALVRVRVCEPAVPLDDEYLEHLMSRSLLIPATSARSGPSTT